MQRKKQVGGEIERYGLTGGDEEKATTKDIRQKVTPTRAWEKIKLKGIRNQQRRETIKEGKK